MRIFETGDVANFFVRKEGQRVTKDCGDTVVGFLAKCIQRISYFFEGGRIDVCLLHLEFLKAENAVLCFLQKVQNLRLTNL